jgi:hypothetical protein
MQNLLGVGVLLIEKQFPASKLGHFAANSNFNAEKVCFAPSVKASI